MFIFLAKLKRRNSIKVHVEAQPTNRNKKGKNKETVNNNNKMKTAFRYIQMLLHSQESILIIKREQTLSRKNRTTAE